MHFNIQLRIGGEVHCTGFYSNSHDPYKPVSKHRADGISTTTGRWISRAVMLNWHTAQQATPAQKKCASPAQAYA